VDPQPPTQALRANSGTYASPMDLSLRSQLQDLFNPEISQLEHMLDWDLSHWR
jgi:hypothetical protein